MNQHNAEAPVLVLREGHAGIIRLNRPKALNALTLDMVRLADAALQDFSEDAGIGLIILEGAGERAFCAGGDIRAVAQSGRLKDGLAEAFWREEYRFISDLAHFPKPVVALMDGIVMGGGAGLAMHVSHRIVTDRTRFAMPETGIGFLPDVGATWALPRAPGETGRYLGLTGETVGPADVIHARLADWHVPAAAVPLVREALTQLPPHGDAQAVAAVAAHFSTRPEPGIFELHEAAIAHSFRHESAADIMEALSRRDGEFARETLAVMRRRSPRSMALTAELLRRGRVSASLEECMTREFHAACRCLETADFHEGVRAAVIDKDRNPHWTPEEPLGPEALQPVPGIADPVYRHRGEIAA